MDHLTSDTQQIHQADDRLWELYHENSKLDLQNGISPEMLAYHLKQIRPCFDYSGLQRFKLIPDLKKLNTDLGELLISRRSCRTMNPGKIG